MKSSSFFFLLLVFAFQISCGDENKKPGNEGGENLVIFFVNDQHGRLNNFAKIKHIVDAEEASGSNVLLLSAGDIFSGNPIVDQYRDKGYPIIDIMNRTGFDLSVIGNHEFVKSGYPFRKQSSCYLFLD